MVFQQISLDADGGGNTPLHVAIEWNSIEQVEYFLELGGEPLVRIKNEEGMDALEFAYAENMEEPYQILNEKLGLPNRYIFCNIF